MQWNEENDDNGTPEHQCFDLVLGVMVIVEWPVISDISDDDGDLAPINIW
jgi:hypothetical protein